MIKDVYSKGQEMRRFILLDKWIHDIIKQSNHAPNYEKMGGLLLTGWDILNILTLFEKCIQSIIL